MKKIVALIVVGLMMSGITSCSKNQDESRDDVVEITPEFTEAVHQFDELYPFSEGLAAVKKNDKFGFINTKGELVIPCQYQYAGPFKEGLACVVKDEEDNNISFIDAKGKMLHTKYPFNSWHYLGGSGQTYIGQAISFTNGVCEIEYTLGDNIGEEPQTVFIDRQMKEVAQPAEESTQSDENLGYEIFSVSDKDIYGEETSLVGVKDKDGKIVIPAKYSGLEICDNGVVLATMFIESAESRFYQARFGEGLAIDGYVDFTGKSTFTDVDMGKLEDYKEAQISAMEQLKFEAEEQARLEEEQASAEEENFAEESTSVERPSSSSYGPEWLQGSWELTIGSPYGAVATYHLTIRGRNAHLVEGRDETYNGPFEIRNGHMIVGPREYRINEDYKRLEYVQYDWHKVGGSGGNSSSSGSGYSFNSPTDVLSYLSGRTFYKSGYSLRIEYDAVYMNGRAMTGAPRVTNFSGSTATVVANSPYSGGGALHFYVNSSNGTVTQNGDVYRAR